jgi:hypothetical protein
MTENTKSKGVCCHLPLFLPEVVTSFPGNSINNRHRQGIFNINGLLVIYCCQTNYPKTQWPKAPSIWCLLAVSPRIWVQLPRGRVVLVRVSHEFVTKTSAVATVI